MTLTAGTSVTLTPVEERLARFIARERQSTNRSADVANKRVGPQTDEDTDREGIAAEIAFARLANVYPDLSTNIRRGSFYCKLRDGRTVDVKTTTYPRGNLIAIVGKRVANADIYALMIGPAPTFTFAGWAKASDLLNEPTSELGYGPTHALPQARLEKILPVDEIVWG